MKRNLFQILMFMTAMGAFASCSKDVDVPRNTALSEPVATQNDATQQSLTVPTLTPRLITIKNGTTVLDSFVYDANRRVVKTFAHSFHDVPLTTTYTYGSGTVAIKRFYTAFPDVVEFDLKGTLDSKGRLVKLEGDIKNDETEGYNESVPMVYTFAYDDLGHLVSWKGKTTTTSWSNHARYFTWSNGNISQSYFYRGGSWSYTTAYSYNLLQPDNRGVWDVVKDEYTALQDFWVSDLLGVRPKNLCTKAVTTWGGSAQTYTTTQSWSLTNGYPVSSTLNDIDISNRPIYLKYAFR